MNTTLFNMIRDINGYNGFGLIFSNYKQSATLTALSAATLTIPADASQYVAIFSIAPGEAVWVAVNATAAVPVGATFASTTSELNPVARLVNKNDVLSFITEGATAAVGVTLYALQSAN